MRNIFILVFSLSFLVSALAPELYAKTSKKKSSKRSRKEESISSSLDEQIKAIENEDDLAAKEEFEAEEKYKKAKKKSRKKRRRSKKKKPKINKKKYSNKYYYPDGRRKDLKPVVKPPMSIHLYKYSLGLALGAGTYSGLTGAYPVGENSFIQVQMGIHALKGTLAVTVDYALEFTDLFGSKTTVPYAGAGIATLMGDDYASLISDTEGDFHFGGRVPFGIYMLFEEMPLQLYAEGALGLLIIADVNPIFGFTIGFRWFFGELNPQQD